MVYTPSAPEASVTAEVPVLRRLIAEHGLARGLDELPQTMTRASEADLHGPAKEGHLIDLAKAVLAKEAACQRKAGNSPALLHTFTHRNPH